MKVYLRNSFNKSKLCVYKVLEGIDRWIIKKKKKRASQEIKNMPILLELPNAASFLLVWGLVLLSYNVTPPSPQNHVLARVERPKTKS